MIAQLTACLGLEISHSTKPDWHSQSMLYCSKGIVINSARFLGNGQRKQNAGIVPII